jgi:hypothetical protein
MVFYVEHIFYSLQWPPFLKLSLYTASTFKEGIPELISGGLTNLMVLFRSLAVCV